MATCRHVALHGLAGLDVDDGGEEEGFAVLAAEIAGDDVVEVGEVGFAVLVVGRLVVVMQAGESAL